MGRESGLNTTCFYGVRGIFMLIKKIKTMIDIRHRTYYYNKRRKEGRSMSDVRKVFITKEAADKLGLNPSYLIKLAKSMNLSEAEMREAGNRNYLFSEEAIEKIKKRN